MPESHAGADEAASKRDERDAVVARAVSVVLLGLRDIELFRRVAGALSEADRLPEGDRRSLEAYGARLRAEGKLEM